MATYVWCELVCNHCSDSLAGEFTTGSIPRAALKKQAKAGGAVFSYGEVYCSEEHRLAAQPEHIRAHEVKS